MSTIKSGKLTQAFATPIWSFEPENAETLAQDLERRVYALEQQVRAPESVGRAGMWQSPGDLHRHTEFDALSSIVLAASAAVVDFMAYDCDLRITSCWANISRREQSLHEHTHPNNFLSGIFYVRVPEGSGVTSFRDPRAQVSILRPRVLRDTPHNSDELQYRPQRGQLLMFPAWLKHSVTPNQTGEDRITMAFNLMLVGAVGNVEDLAAAELD